MARAPSEERSAGSDEPRRGGDKPSAARVYLPRKALVLGLLVASLFGGGAAALVYWQYAAVHLRPIARMPRCIMGARRGLATRALVSGSEPYPTPDGEVYLTPAENRAVHCVESVSKPLAIRFANAFTEQEPELRGLELLKVLREVPPDPARDQEATVAYFVSGAAMRALPEVPETKAASDELKLLHACRFDTKEPCPTRPPMPALVWVTGVPSSIGLLFALGMLGRAAVLRAIDWRRARRKQPPAGKA